MQLVIQFQTFYNKRNMLTKKYNQKMNKGGKGSTEVKIAPLTLFNLSFGHVTCYQSFMMKTLFSNIIKLHRVVEKRFLFVSCQFSSEMRYRRD